MLLQVLACGICGTDVRSFYNGDRRIEPPWVLGHEICGEVVEIGPRARGRGRPRAASRSATPCTASRRSGAGAAACAAAAPRTCACNGELMGFDHPGAYAERVAIPNIALKNLFRIPDGPVARARHVRRPAVGRDLRPQGHRDRPRRRRRRHRRRPGRHRARRARPAAGRRPGAAARAHRATGSSSREAILGDDRAGLRRHRGRRRHRRGHARDRGLRRRRRDRRLLERHRPGGGDGDGRAARARAVLRRPAEGHDAHPVPLERPALQGGAGARLVRLAPPRPGARARHARRRRGGIRSVVSDVIGARRDARTRSRGSAPARRSRSSSRRDHRRAASLRHSLAEELRDADRRGRVAARASGCPSEPELARQLGVSRASMRAAITLLEEEGFVRRRHGSGTYVTHRPLLRNDLGRNFGVSSHDRRDGPRAGHGRRELRGAEPAPREVAEALGIEEGEPVSVLRRVRTADGRRVVDVTDWCRVEHLAPEDAADGRLDLRGAGRARAGGRTTASRTLTPRQRRRRGRRSGWTCRAARCC